MPSGNVTLTAANGCDSIVTVDLTFMDCGMATPNFVLRDPCSCNNPANIVLNDGSYLFNDTLIIDLSQYTAPYPTVTITPLDNNTFDNLENRITSPTNTVVDLRNGLFGFVFYTKASQSTSISATVDGVTEINTTSSCEPCINPIPIPTTSAWGLLIFGLLILNLGILLLLRFKSIQVL